MSKLLLRLDDLQVETFEPCTTPMAHGTVFGRGATDGDEACGSDEHEATCDLPVCTRQNTCAVGCTTPQFGCESDRGRADPPLRPDDRHAQPRR